MNVLALNLFTIVSLGFYSSTVVGLPNGFTNIASQESIPFFDSLSAKSPQLPQDDAFRIMSLNQRLFNQMDQLDLNAESSKPQIWKSPEVGQSTPQAPQEEKNVANEPAVSAPADRSAGSLQGQLQQKVSSVMQNVEQAAETINKKLDSLVNSEPGSFPPKT
ncbi:hypothetical protein K7432_013790 [Basidiobolus ranarum]|uniref:Uncharacterized protein n=1 Tax=Basidiobolus ranarum TaxID=34480 RepID=A0ABR2WIN1_9FUNG